MTTLINILTLWIIHHREWFPRKVRVWAIEQMWLNLEKDTTARFNSISKKGGSL